MRVDILTVVGARPQFIKAAVVSHELEKTDLSEVLVHTGQHFDYNMSGSFFEELQIPEPVVNLNISGGTHAQMTARMLEALERTMVEIAPRIVLLYGDTNSTLAGALAAAKLRIPIVHVEAGARTNSRENPEEINRRCVDHVSTILLACTESGMSFLDKEGLSDCSFFVGDPMYDAFVSHRAKSVRPMLEGLDGSFFEAPDIFYYLTCHREENTQDERNLRGVLNAMQQLDAPVVYPVHPRNKECVQQFVRKGSYDNILFVNPVGYLESIWLVSHAVQVVTDSGGLQREAFFAGVKCTTLFDFVSWPETMLCNRNILAQPNPESILDAMGRKQQIDPHYKPFGDGHAAQKIVSRIQALLEEVEK